MQRYKLPEPVILYISTLNSCLNGHVTGPKWESESFSFRKGIFQGDPWSPVIFLMTLNPILEYLLTIEEKYGYNLNNTQIITLMHLSM